MNLPAGRADRRRPLQVGGGQEGRPLYRKKASAERGASQPPPACVQARQLRAAQWDPVAAARPGVAERENVDTGTAASVASMTTAGHRPARRSASASGGCRDEVDRSGQLSPERHRRADRTSEPDRPGHRRGRIPAPRRAPTRCQVVRTVGASRVRWAPNWLPTAAVATTTAEPAVVSGRAKPIRLAPAPCACSAEHITGSDATTELRLTCAAHPGPPGGAVAAAARAAPPAAVPSRRGAGPVGRVASP